MDAGGAPAEVTDAGVGRTGGRPFSLWRSPMQRRTLLAAVVIAALTVSVSTAAAKVSTPGGTAAGSITVWLQVDAQSGWPEVVAAATKQFQQEHPGTDVRVQYQNWGDHLQKFDATLAGG